MASRHIPYFKFYPSDFMNGVRGMTAQEVGVYVMLLSRIYEENGPVECSPVKLATYCGMREKTFAKVMARLVDLGKVRVENGRITNDRALSEISSRANDLKNNSKAGKKSAEKRNENNGATPTTVEQAFNHTDTDTDTSKRDTKVSLVRSKADRFDEFWNSYPHRNGAKKGKADALKKYEALVKSGTSEEEIISGARRYHQDRSVIDGFAKDPKTWINQKCWNDEIEPHTSRHLTKAGSPKNDRQRFDQAHREFARRIGSGEIQRGPDPSDPFA